MNIGPRFGAGNSAGNNDPFVYLDNLIDLSKKRVEDSFRAEGHIDPKDAADRFDREAIQAAEEEESDDEVPQQGKVTQQIANMPQATKDIYEQSARFWASTAQQLPQLPKSERDEAGWKQSGLQA